MIVCLAYLAAVLRERPVECRILCLLAFALACIGTPRQINPVLTLFISQRIQSFSSLAELKVQGSHHRSELLPFDSKPQCVSFAFLTSHSRSMS